MAESRAEAALHLAGRESNGIGQESGQEGFPVFSGCCRKNQ